MTDKSLAIWGIPVMVSDEVPDGEIRLVAGQGVIREDGVIEWDGDVWRIKNLGEPYDV